VAVPLHVKIRASRIDLSTIIWYTGRRITESHNKGAVLHYCDSVLSTLLKPASSTAPSSSRRNRRVCGIWRAKLSLDTESTPTTTKLNIYRTKPAPIHQSVLS